MGGPVTLFMGLLLRLMHRWWSPTLSVALAVLTSCATSRVTVAREQLDSSTVRHINIMLADADVELHLRGGVRNSPLLHGRTTFVVAPPSVLAIGERDTVAIPIEYVAELRGSHRRSVSRLVIGGIGGLLAGAVVGIIVAPAAPLPFGIGGAVVGVTAAGLLSQQIVVRFESQPK